jgi:hypothetical protein
MWLIATNHEKKQKKGKEEGHELHATTSSSYHCCLQLNTKKTKIK